MANKKTVKELKAELAALGVTLTGEEKQADLQALLDKATPPPVSPENDPAADLDEQIAKDTKAPEGVPTGKTGVVSDTVSPIREDKAGVKTIAPTGRFESIGNLIFNEFGQHCGTEENDSVAARKAGSFNTQRKFR